MNTGQQGTLVLKEIKRNVNCRIPFDCIFGICTKVTHVLAVIDMTFLARSRLSYHFNARIYVCANIYLVVMKNIITLQKHNSCIVTL